MDIFAAFLMILPVVGLFASGVILILMFAIGGYSLVDWWLARKTAVREMSLTGFEKLPS